MKRAAIFFYPVHGVQKGGVFEKGSVLHGERDPWEVLVDDSSGAKRHMADFAVSGRVPWKSDGDAGRLECGEGIIFVEFFYRGKLRFSNGVSLSAEA